MEWKWTKGEPYPRTKRIPNNSIALEPGYTNENEVEKSTQELAYSCSLNHDENTWELLNQSVNGFNQNVNGFKYIDKRGDTDKRMAEREMISQVSMNPFLTNNNYVEDIVSSNNFLTPQYIQKGNGASE